MYIGLDSPRRRLLFATCALTLVALYVALAARGYFAFRLAQQLDPGSLVRATRLDPWNASHWNRLGRLLAFGQQEFHTAIAPLERATRLNSHSAPYWLDLVSAYEFSGQEKEQQDALERALELDPRNPDLTWQAANFYFVMGQADRGLDLMRSAVDSNPDLLGRALDLGLRITSNDYVRVMDRVLPARSDLHLQAVRSFAHAGKTDAADVAWSRLVALNQPFSARASAMYLDSLLKRRQSERLRRAWMEVVRLNPELAEYTPGAGSLIVNGGFETPVTNLGLDWRYSPKPGVRVEADTANLRSGAASLRITFERQRVAETGLHQFVPVESGACYEFSGYLKTRSLEAAGGARFVVRDANSGRLYFLSDGPTGTHAWMELHGAFRADPETAVLAVAVARVPGNTLAQGEVWVDDLRLSQSTGCQ